MIKTPIIIVNAKANVPEITFVKYSTAITTAKLNRMFRSIEPMFFFMISVVKFVDYVSAVI